MRRFYLFFLVSLLSFTQVSSSAFAISAPSECSITLTLRIGSKGLEVQCLQTKVKAVVDGSFGPATKAAVVRFQSAHGLVADGIVGPISRIVLNSFTNLSIVTLCPNGNTLASNCTTANNKSQLSSQNTTNTVNTNPNLMNLDKFIETVVEVNRDNGSSEAELKLMANALKTAMINSSVNYNEEFKNTIIRESKLSFSIIDNILSFLGITPTTAYAAGIPFGGKLLSSFFCQNGSWMIGLSPLPPNFATLLSYTPGTQGFASYNIPYTGWLLGTYTPPGVCVISYYPPITVNTQGTITPVVGSSPTPA